MRSSGCSFPLPNKPIISGEGAAGAGGGEFPPPPRKSGGREGLGAVRPSGAELQRPGPADNGQARRARHRCAGRRAAAASSGKVCAVALSIAPQSGKHPFVPTSPI